MVIKKLAIIDGSYFLHRSLKVAEIYDLIYKGVRTGGIFQFLRLINFELSDLNSYPVVVFDGGLSELRTSLYPNYKKQADRSNTSERYESNMMTDEEVGEYEAAQEYMETYRNSRNVLVDLLKQLGIPVLIKHGTEGDDWIAAISKSNLSEESVILTDDKDLIQLVSPRVSNYRPMKKEMIDYSFFGNDKEYINPTHYMIVKAIVGDGSDNIPQIQKGVGVKKALLIASEYMVGGVDAIRKYVTDNQRLKWCKSMVDNLDWIDQLLINLQLVDLVNYTNDQLVNEARDEINKMLDVQADIQPLQYKLNNEYGIKELDLMELSMVLSLSKYLIRRD